MANLGTSESLLLEDSSEYNFETCKLTEFFFTNIFLWWENLYDLTGVEFRVDVAGVGGLGEVPLERVLGLAGLKEGLRGVGLDLGVVLVLLAAAGLVLLGLKLGLWIELKVGLPLGLKLGLGLGLLGLPLGLLGLCLRLLGLCLRLLGLPLRLLGLSLGLNCLFLLGLPLGLPEKPEN